MHEVGGKGFLSSGIELQCGQIRPATFQMNRSRNPKESFKHFKRRYVHSCYSRMFEAFLSEKSDWSVANYSLQMKLDWFMTGSNSQYLFKRTQTINIRHSETTSSGGWVWQGGINQSIGKRMNSSLSQKLKPHHIIFPFFPSPPPLHGPRGPGSSIACSLSPFPDMLW